MTVIQTLTAVSKTSKRTEKEKLIGECSDKNLLKQIVLYTHQPWFDYGIKAFKKVDVDNEQTVDYTPMFDLFDKLIKRELSGNAAKQACQDMYSSLDRDSAQLFVNILTHNLKCGVGPETFNKVLGECVYVHPYRRCKSLSKKNLEKITLPAFSQVKEDGAYNDVIVTDSIKIMSRNGLTCDYRLPNNLMDLIQTHAKDYVLMGEARVWSEDRTRLLPREEGNGVLSSDNPDTSRICMIFWDCLPVDEFNATTVSSQTDRQRFDKLIEIVNLINHTPNDQIRVVETRVVNTVDDIIKHFRESLERGEEGTVVKNFNGYWSHGESPDCVKIKIVFDCDLIIDNSIEGTGKNKGRLGAWVLRTADNKLQVNVGIGFSDAQRIEFWEHREELNGCVVTIKANEVLSKSELASLFLPRSGISRMSFVEIRKDKKEGDTLQRVLAQRNAIYDIIDSMRI